VGTEREATVVQAHSPMNPFLCIEGQRGAHALLSRALEEGRLASAYLFEGPSGVGKERTAMALATHVVTRGDAALRERVEKGNHPDVRVFRPRDEGSRNLPVEVIREDVLPVVQFAPFEAAATFLIFPEADVSFPEAHPEAANAFLKTLEEPPKNVHFILLAERPDRLLKTTRSRCQRVRFAPLAASLLDRILERANIETAARGPAIALAGGRADRALELARGSRVVDLFDLALDVDAAANAKKPGERLDRAEAIRNSEDPLLSLEALAVYYRDLAILTSGMPATALSFSNAAARLESRAARTTCHAAAAREGKVRAAMESLERGANAQIVLEALLMDLARVA
jgi:DNA polymerase III subunit delta'